MNTDPRDQMTSDKPLLGKSINPSINSHEMTPVDLVKSHSALDPVLWLVALALLVGATLIPQYLPAYWAPAANTWTRLGVIAGVVVLALVLIGVSSQGRGLVTLLKDAQVELRRITWPTKADTLHTTWIVLVVVIVMGLILWLMDLFFGWAIQFIIG
jgi:preprotein translocase subunit SecE